MKGRIEYLYSKCISNIATAAEHEEFIQLMRLPENSIVAKQLLMNALREDNEKVSVDDDTSESIIQAIVQSDRIQREPVISRANRFSGTGWMRYAAAVLIVLSTTIFLWFMTRSKEAPVSTATITPAISNDVPPGGNRAILTLADGSTIVLDSAANGKLTRQGGTQVIKLANGNLAYVNGDNKMTEPVFNTMTTPRGGQYQLRLPDGSEVWLNAASSITYPTSFTGKERKVKMSGEAYFEIAKNSERPFQVEVNGMTVAVLGTHFNVNAYSGNAFVKTTLLEGVVEIVNGNAKKMLQSGQQAQVNEKDNIKIVSDVDKEEVVAWKNGYFHFTDADMPSVMKELERWYDIEVSYEGEIPVRSFGGGIQRSLALSKVLTILEENEVKFRIQGRKITVLK
jgi:transmembrane sensor